MSDASPNHQIPAIAAFHLGKIGEEGRGKKYEMQGNTRAELQWLIDRDLIKVMNQAAFEELEPGSEFNLDDYLSITEAGQRILTLTPPLAFILSNEEQLRNEAVVKELAD